LLQVKHAGEENSPHSHVENRCAKIVGQTMGVGAFIVRGSPFAACAQITRIGENASRFSRNGECDDKRFAGSG
jgi:hypothetical protein